MSQGEIASHFLRKSEFLSQQDRKLFLSQGEIVSFFTDGHHFFPQGRQCLSQKKVVSNARRSYLFIFLEKEWLCLKQKRSLSRGEVASLLFIKKLLSLPQTGCLCLRENVSLRFREERPLPQKEVVSVEMVPVSEKHSLFVSGKK